MNPTLSLISKRPIVSNIWLFTFQSSRPLDWKAGQFIKVELPHEQPDSEGTKRFFTIASAPADGAVQIAARITASSFKQALSRLSVGGQLKLIDLPAGDFIWPDSDKPIVFAAQGIGITPVRSILRQRLAKNQTIPAALIYANLAPGIPFTDELNEWGSRPEFQVHHLDQPITPVILASLQPNLAAALVYVTGPKSLTQLLMPPYNLPVAHLKQDQFPNYAQADY